MEASAGTPGPSGSNAVQGTFACALGVSEGAERCVEAIDGNKVLYPSGTSLCLHDTAVNALNFVRDGERWQAVLVTAVSMPNKHTCALVVLTGSGRGSIAKQRKEAFDGTGNPRWNANLSVALVVRATRCDDAMQPRVDLPADPRPFPPRDLAMRSTCRRSRP